MAMVAGALRRPFFASFAMGAGFHESLEDALDAGTLEKSACWTAGSWFL